MTPEEIVLVQKSFAKVVPMAAQAAKIFYATLFKMDPELKKLFKNDLDAQGKKLMDTLAVVVNSLDKLEQVQPAVKALATRHVDYGVKEEDYVTVGHALLSTLQQGLQDDFTPEVRSAWVQAYNILSSVMIESHQKKRSRLSA